MVTYQLNTDWAGLISVVENRDPNLWLQVSMRTCLKPSTEPILVNSSPTKDSQQPLGPNNNSCDEALNYSHNVIRSEDVNGHDQTQMFVTSVVDSGTTTGKQSSSALAPIDICPTDNECDLHYLASTRNTLTTRDVIPPGHW